MIADYHFLSAEDRAALHREPPMCEMLLELDLYVRREVELRRAFIVLIGGPSCVGKSSLAVELAHALGVRTVIGTDSIRLALAAASDDPRASPLRYRSHESWRSVSGDFARDNLVRGFALQCNALREPLLALVHHAADQVQNTIVEGVHLTPMMTGELATTVNACVLSLFVTTTQEYQRGILVPRRRVSTYMKKNIDDPAGEAARNMALRISELLRAARVVGDASTS